MTMTRVLPPLHEGHAPIYLHLAFENALDAFEGWGLLMDEPEVEFEGRKVPISSVFGRMRTCSDLLPARLVEAVRDVVGKRALGLAGDGVTFADAAVLLRALCVERLKATA